MPASDALSGGVTLLNRSYLSEHEEVTSPSRLGGDTGLLRRRFKGHRSSKKSVHAYSDYGEADTDGGGDNSSMAALATSAAAAAAAAAAAMGPRSVSLTALHPTGGTRSGRISAGGVPLLEPRMAQLETLEAKMASIEVSLSSSSLGPTGAPPRRPKRSLASPVSLLMSRTTPLSATPTSILPSPRASPIPPPIPSSPAPSITSSTTPVGNREAAAAAAASREIEALRNALRDKENVIQSLRNQIGNAQWRPVQSQIPALGDKERRAIEDRLSKVRQEAETKRLAIKNLKMALERLDITDNIDVRIQQAEAEFQLGREELALLALAEESRALAARLEETSGPQNHPTSNHQPACTLHSVVAAAVPSPQKMLGKILNIVLNCDPSNPNFGLNRRSAESPLAPTVEWASNDCNLEAGDRLLEINGKLVLGAYSEDVVPLLTAGSVRLVVLRVSPLPPPSPAPPPDTAALILKEATALREELAAARERIAEQNPEAEKVKKERDTLKAENMRLFHRISYLEEQVTDLVKDKDAIKHQSNNKGEVHVFQKGSHVTTIVTSLQGGGPSNRGGRWNGHGTDDQQSEDARSTRSLDVLHKPRPAPPKKPQRLSLPRATSLLEGLEPPRKPSKRSHKGGALMEGSVKASSTAAAEATLRWSSPTPNCALPASAQYHNHTQHLLNFRRSNVSVGDEKWC